MVGGHRPSRLLVLLVSALLFMAVLGMMILALANPASADVQSASQNLQSAQQRASAANNALSTVQQQLADSQQRLAQLQQKVVQSQAVVASDDALVKSITTQLQSDRQKLRAFMRASYEHGGVGAFINYLLSAKTIGQAVARKAQLDKVSQASDRLVAQIVAEQNQAQSALAQAQAARAQAVVAAEQAATTEALIAAQEAQLQDAATAANKSLAAAQGAYNAAVAAARQAQNRGVTYSPVPSDQFTVDTDLTAPSGETAATLNQFLSGTALAGLGDSFMHAEQQFHVSARYFVAHAILESAWGTSAIAQDKHNLFGYGADDRNPYGDALSFPSFDACIQFVAQRVASDYLDPNGRFYHGPTLRGMNVDYASDPNWADKIARIADTIP